MLAGKARPFASDRTWLLGGYRNPLHIRPNWP
jgi:hypothetical protein